MDCWEIELHGPKDSACESPLPSASTGRSNSGITWSGEVLHTLVYVQNESGAWCKVRPSAKSLPKSTFGSSHSLFIARGGGVYGPSPRMSIEAIASR